MFLCRPPLLISCTSYSNIISVSLWLKWIRIDGCVQNWILVILNWQLLKVNKPCKKCKFESLIGQKKNENMRGKCWIKCKQKLNRRERWGMGNEGSRLLAFSVPLDTPYFFHHSHLQWVLFFGRERKRHRSHECSVTRDCHNENLEPHSNLVLLVLVSSAKLLRSLVIGCVWYLYVEH